MVSEEKVSAQCQNSPGLRVAFATHAWERSWQVVLSPERFRMVLESHLFRFAEVLVVLNNIKSFDRALRWANYLMENNLCTAVISALDYLTDSRLKDLGLELTRFWRHNPYFSTAQFAALHYLRDKVDYVLHLNGDVWLERPAEWIPAAISALREEPRIRGFSLCRNIYLDFYPRVAHAETSRFWISKPELFDIPGNPHKERCGFVISDHAYVLPVSPEPYWIFAMSDEEYEKIALLWPAYARPCFEMYYTAAMFREGWWHAALKPENNRPVIKHKNFPRSKLKLNFYKLCGFYKPGGRFATHYQL